MKPLSLLIVSLLCLAPNRTGLQAATAESLDRYDAVRPQPSTSTSPDTNTRITQCLAAMPMVFTQNCGQWDDRVLYRADAGTATIWFTREGAAYEFSRLPSPSDASHDRAGRPCPFQPAGGDQTPVDAIEQMVIHSRFLGAAVDPRIDASEQADYVCHYIKGNDPEQWHTSVPCFQSITYRELYPGIDLTFYGNGTHMEYDFIVSPGADASAIRIHYDGIQSLAVNESGGLVLETPWGTLTESVPLVYQVADDGSRVAMQADFALEGPATFGFEMPEEYDPFLLTTIDPELDYSTYLGGSSLDEGFDIAADWNYWTYGFAYVTGYTVSTDFPHTTGSQNGDRDAFVTKLSKDGSSLEYSLFIGGEDRDEAYGISTNIYGETVIVGYTESSDFPTTASAYDRELGGFQDGFVTCLTASGTIAWSTYLGGNNSDCANAVAMDSEGYAFVTGQACSNDFPTVNAYDNTLSSSCDAFVTKVSNLGSSLSYSTYLGGDNWDHGKAIAVDDDGNAYVTGYTESDDFDTVNAYQDAQAGGNDAFVSKLSSSGASLLFSTYFGGTGDDAGTGLALDDDGNVYITGYTYSSDLDTLAPYQGTYGGNRDAFVTKFSSSGTSLVYSTYLGSSAADHGNDIAVGPVGHAFVVGVTSGSGFPLWRPVVEYTPNGSEGFLTQLSLAGSQLIHSSLIGGNDGNDDAHGVAVNQFGAVYIAGSTNSDDFPTEDPYDGSYNGSYDAFVSKIHGCECTCHHDPTCDGIVNIYDVVVVVHVAFRGGTPYFETNCPFEVTDVDCSGFTNVLDVVKSVNVAFRGHSSASQFCVACEY